MYFLPLNAILTPSKLVNWSKPRASLKSGPYKCALIAAHNLLWRRYHNPRDISWTAARALRLPQCMSRNTRNTRQIIYAMAAIHELPQSTSCRNPRAATIQELTFSWIAAATARRVGRF